MQAGWASVDGASWPAWASWAKGPISILYDTCLHGPKLMIEMLKLCLRP